MTCLQIVSSILLPLSRSFVLQRIHVQTSLGLSFADSNGHGLRHIQGRKRNCLGKTESYQIHDMNSHRVFRSRNESFIIRITVIGYEVKPR